MGDGRQGTMESGSNDPTLDDTILPITEYRTEIL